MVKLILKFKVIFQPPSSDRINTTKQGLALASTLIPTFHPLANYFFSQLIANNQFITYNIKASNTLNI